MTVLLRELSRAESHFSRGYRFSGGFGGGVGASRAGGHGWRVANGPRGLSMKRCEPWRGGAEWAAAQPRRRRARPTRLPGRLRHGATPPEVKFGANRNWRWAPVINVRRGNWGSASALSMLSPNTIGARNTNDLIAMLTCDNIVDVESYWAFRLALSSEAL